MLLVNAPVELLCLNDVLSLSLVCLYAFVLFLSFDPVYIIIRLCPL
jgi:hypothetical protein